MTPDRAALPTVTWRAFRSRPRILIAILAGCIVALGLWLIPNELRVSTRGVLSWDAAALTFITLMMVMMSGSDVSQIQATAAAQDEGQGATLALSVLAAAVSVLGIAAELGIAKADQEPIKALRVGLAFTTIALSWFFIHLIFAIHYAHEYYSPETCPDQEGHSERGGLGFPGKEQPDYWDFLHFAVVIGVASQTADISFTAKPLRRIGTMHGALSFVFNTVVLALTINLLAGLF